MAFLIEMVVDGRVNGGEFLQTSHPSKPLHRSFPSSEWSRSLWPNLRTFGCTWLGEDRSEFLVFRDGEASWIEYGDQRYDACD